MKLNTIPVRYSRVTSVYFITMRCRFGRSWATSIFTIAAIAAQQRTGPETATEERLYAALAGLQKVVTDKRMPEYLRSTAENSVGWLGVRLLTKEQWKGSNATLQQRRWEASAEREPKNTAAPAAGPPAPIPAAYVASLEVDLKMLQAALGKNDSKQSEERTLAAVQDLKIKSDDCLKFGRARMVDVEVSTVKAGQLVKDAQVYYKYVAVGDLPTARLPMDSADNPAHQQLSPGLYDFQAEAAVDGNLVVSAAMRAAVGGVPVVRLAIRIAH